MRVNARSTRGKRWGLATLVGLGGILATLSSCSTDSGPEPLSNGAVNLNAAPKIGDFAIYALRSVNLGIHDIILGGDVGVQRAAASSFGPQLLVGDYTQVDSTHNLLAPSVTVGAHAQVGDVQTNAFVNEGANAIGKVASFPAAVMPPGPFAPPTSSTGADVSVASKQTVSLSAGAYGALIVGDHGSVNLGPGAYTFASITLGQHCQVTADPAGVQIVVTGSYATSGWNFVMPAAPAAADKLSITVLGADPSSTQPAVSVALHDQITGLLAAPNGTLSLSDYVQVVGAVAGFDVALAPHVQLTFQSGFPASPAGSQPLSGYVNPPASSQPVVGPVPAATPIFLSVTLPVQNAPMFNATAADVSNPKSASYRQYISPSTFAGTYGLTPTDYAKVTTWAQSYGLAVGTYPNHLFMTAAGTAAQVEAALNVNLIYATRLDGTQFYEPDREPSVNLSVTVLDIAGTDDYDVPRPLGSTGAGGTYSANDIRNAYVAGCSSLTGAGQTVGVVGLQQYNPSDITKFESISGIVGAPAVNPVSVFGNLMPPQPTPANNATNAAGNLEIASDIELVLAMAPGATVVPIQGPATSAGLNAILQTIAATPSIGQSTSSFGVVQKDNDRAASQQAVTQMVLQGQGFFQASGDDGAYDPNANGSCFCLEEAPPLDSPRDLLNLTLAGGTALTMNGSGVSWASETTWASTPACQPSTNLVGSGGGVFSTPIGTLYPMGMPIPSFQIGLANAANQASSSNRNSPDVSMVATGIQIVATQAANPTAMPPTPILPNQTFSWNGTSAASPLWAGFSALLNQQTTTVLGQPPVGFISPALYAIAAQSPNAYALAFHDIADGSNNGNGCVAGFTAVTGYDLATGLGTPQCGLIKQVPALASPPQVTITISSISYGTTGSNLFNCGNPAGGRNNHNVSGPNVDSNGNLVYTCNPIVSKSGTQQVISSQTVTFNQQVGCGDGQGAIVTISCSGSGQPGDIGISGSVQLALSNNCDGSQNGQSVPNPGLNSPQTFTFTNVIPGTPQNGYEDSCDNNNNSCASDPCNFNEFYGQIDVANTGGY